MPIASMVVAAYNRPKQILVTLHSLLVQTLQDFEIIVVHDGSGSEVRRVVERIGDARIRFVETSHRMNDWGNSSKEHGSLLATGTYIGQSNDDNYYAPLYFEQMVGALAAEQAEFVYCNMVHSHRRYTPLVTNPTAGWIDGGGWLCSASIVKTTRWPEPKSDSYADGHYAESLVARCRTVAKVHGYLFVHN